MPINQSLFIPLLVSSLAFLKTISCTSVSECISQGYAACLTSDGDCTSDSTNCDSSSSFPTFAIVIPIVFFCVFVVLFIICCVIARRRAALSRIQYTENQQKVQANFNTIMQGANNNNNNTANMTMQQQVLQQQMIPQQNMSPQYIEMKQVNQQPQTFSYQQQQPQQQKKMANQMYTNKGVISYI